MPAFCIKSVTLNEVLKELRNCISRIIRVWSLFCSIRVYTSLHFLPILLVNYLILCLSTLFALCQIQCNLHKLYNIYIFIAYIAVVRYYVFLFSLISKIRYPAIKSTTFNKKNMPLGIFWAFEYWKFPL